MGSFSRFDSRNYPTVAAREGYERWAATYEDTVEDAMDTALLERLGVGADVATRRPSGLSGGQLQRAAVARAMLADPDVLVCDEVTSALDAERRDELLVTLDALRRERGTTLVVISHDLPLVGAIADVTTVLDDGRVV